MTLPTREERLELWKFAYARASFVDAAIFLDELFAANYPLGSPMRKAISIAVTTVYARPFKQRSAVRLPDDIVPQRHKATHDSIIEIRDKSIAHRDIDGPITDLGLLLNQVQFAIRNSTVYVDTISPIFSDEKAHEVHALVKELISKMDYHVNKYMVRFFVGSGTPDGTYEMSLEPSLEQWLKRLPMQSNQATRTTSTRED